MNESINIFTQRFNDTKIESEYLDFKWPRIWPYLKAFLFFSLLIKAFVMFEDIKLLGLKIPYISYHIFDIIVFIVFMFILSNNNKKKYHQIYMGLSWIGFMNIGAWTYHFSPFDFPPGEGVVITLYNSSTNYLSFSFIERSYCSIMYINTSYGNVNSKRNDDH